MKQDTDNVVSPEEKPQQSDALTIDEGKAKPITSQDSSLGTVECSEVKDVSELSKGATGKTDEQKSVQASDNGKVMGDGAAEQSGDGSVSASKMNSSFGLSENITLPNLTLGRDKPYVEYQLVPGTILSEEYAPDGRPWMETKEVKIEKTDNGFRVMPKEGVTGQLSFDVFYNEGKRAKFHLTVNPDPWSLWTVKGPTEELMRFDQDKDRIANRHQSEIKYEDDLFTVIGASRRGRSHEHSGTFRDDDLGFWEDKSTGRYVFIVADGAGSAKFSREGSRMAIQFLKEKLPANLSAALWAADADNLQPTGKVGSMLVTLAYHAYDHIDKYVRAENEKHPEDKWEVRDFNTTLLIAAVKCDAGGGMRLVTFSIGDGAIAWFGGEESALMCAPDGGEFGGGTRFLTTKSVWEKAGKDYQAFYKERVFCKRFTPEEAKRTSLFLMTDGVSDPWFETDASLNDTTKWRTFLEDTLFSEGENKAGLKPYDTVDTKARKLMDWLYFKIPGNHDDRTLIVVQPRNMKSDSVDNKEEAANG